MRNVVADTSCIVDLRKAHLLEFIFALPYVFVVPDTLFEDEWLSLTLSEKNALRDKGLEIRELPGVSVARAARYFNQYSRLKLNDCFALALSEDIEDSITTDGRWTSQTRRRTERSRSARRPLGQSTSSKSTQSSQSEGCTRRCSSSAPTTLSFFRSPSSCGASGDWRSCCRGGMGRRKLRIV